MAKRRSFFQRVVNAVRHFFENDEPAPAPIQERSQAVSGVEFSVPATGDIPGLSYENDDTADEREARRQLVRNVMEWFTAEGAYWDTGIGRYVNEHGDMRSPAKLTTVVRNISEFTTIEVDFGLDMTRIEWQDLASRNASYWYH